MSELNQLLLEFDHKIEFNEHDYYVSKSNFFAFNLIQNWPNWEKKILNISGDKFSGKTHLAKIFQSKSKALYFTHENRNDEWRIAKRVIVHDWSMTAQLDSDSFPLPMDSFIQGTRDTSDLVYQW